MRLSLVVLAVLLCLVPAMSAASDVKGTVTDKDGKPVANAAVFVLTRVGKSVSKRTIYTAKDGKFTCPSPVEAENGCYMLLALADGYSYGSARISTGEETDLTIVLWPEHKLRGKVVDENGNALVGARVSVEFSHACNSESTGVDFNFYGEEARVCDVTTGDDGSFILSHLPGPDTFSCGRVVFNVRKNGRALMKKLVEIENMREEITVIDPPACRLQGTLHMPGKSTPAPEGVELMVRLLGETAWNIRDGKTGKDGKFEFSQLPPGKVQLMLGPNFWLCRGADGRTYAPAQGEWVLPAVEVDLSPDRDCVVEPVLSQGSLVRGKVADRSSGEPVAGAIVCAWHSGRPEWSIPNCVDTDAKGEFAVRVAAGEVKLSVHDIPWRGDQVVFQSDEVPSVTTTVAEGQERTGIELRVSPADSEKSARLAARKPIPPDFELKPGTYDLQWDPDVALFSSVNPKIVYTGDEVTARIARMPQLVSSKPRRGAFRFDGVGDSGLIAMVADESQGTGKGYDTAYIDLNRNWDLSDDEPVKWKPAEDGIFRPSNWAVASACQGSPEGDNTRNSVKVRLGVCQQGDSLNTWLERKGAWRGLIDSSGGKVECLLVDSNCNGLYGDPIEIKDDYNFEYGDFAFIDTNGFGCAIASGDKPHDVQLNNVTALDGRFYVIRSNGVGSKITIEPYDGPIGKLLVRSSAVPGRAVVAALHVTGKSGHYALATDGEAVSLPAGDYEITHCVLEVASAGKDAVRLACSSRQTAAVEPDRQVAADLGSNLWVAVNPETRRMVVSPGSDVKLHWRLQIGDETIVRSISGSKKNYAATVRLLGADGGVLASASVKNACPDCGGACTLGVRTPNLKPGRYRMQLAIDTKMALGTIVSEVRQFYVQDPAYDRLLAEYKDAKNAGDTAGAVKAREGILTRGLRHAISPGEPIGMNSEDQTFLGKYPGPDKLSAVMKWYPEKDYLRVRAEVVDGFFSTDAPKDAPWLASSVELFVSPGGTGESTTQLVIVPVGAGGRPRLYAARKEITEGVDASWKRTAKGYVVEAKVPWRNLAGCREPWTVLPIQACVNAKTPNERLQLTLTSLGEPWNVGTYAALKAPAR